MSCPILQFSHVSKKYSGRQTEVDALIDITFNVEPGESLAIVGRSGSGKSTLLHLAGLLDRPSRGQVLLNGHEISSLTDTEQALRRNQEIGFIFQSFYLLARVPILETVMQPLIIRGLSLSAARSAAEKALDEVELFNEATRPPSQLSGGQRQRVAIARAIVGGASVLLADEPTGNLDNLTATLVMGILLDLQSKGRTLLIVTHDPDVAALCDRKICMEGGRLTSDTSTRCDSE